MVQTRSSAKRPQVPGGSSSSTGTDGSQPAARPRGAKNPREAISTRQTTMATNMEPEMQSDSDRNLLTPSPFSLFESPSSSPLFNQASSRSSTVSPLPEDVVQVANATVSAPASGTNRARKRWTVDMNKFIWRTYLIATKLNTSKLYLDHLHHEFTVKYPQMEASRQRLGDQCRAIIRNKLLPQNILDDIKNDVTLLLRQAQSEPAAQSLVSFPIPNTQGQRRKWTTEYNESIIRNYYKITELGENRSAYRRPFYQAVVGEYPELSEVSEQRISDQLRVILNNRMISEHRLAEIRDEVANGLSSCRSNAESSLTAEEAQPSRNSLEPTPQVLESQLHTSMELQDIRLISDNFEDDQIKDQFKTSFEKFRDSDPTTRPYIPKQKTSRKQAQILQYINTHILPHYIKADQNFETTHTIIYCAAYTAAICNGTKIREGDYPPTQNKRRVPAWQRRLQKKILDIRKDIARMTEYIKGNRSNRLIKLVEVIKNKNQIHSQHEVPNTSNEHFLDTLKQKLNAAASRLQRYVNCTLRKTQNSQFSKNQKQFYRNLSMNTQHFRTPENIVPAAPSDLLHDFWSSVWSDPVQHNSDAEWLRASCNSTDKITPMEYDHIPLDVFMYVLKKAHNWKAPGSDRIHNYWYKKLTSIHPVLYNHINSFIQTPELVPRFVTQGLTFMIPKDADYRDPSKYRPITCLQTVYKILTACIAELIYKHSTNNKILAEEQKGCRKGSQGCKEQLIIDSVAMKHAIGRKKDINTMYVDYCKAFDSVPHSWLLHVLRHYKVNHVLIQFLLNSMQHWTTKLKILGCQQIETSEIPIRRGIFQGDALSPLWFCLALNPLSHMLNSYATGFDIITPSKKVNLTHLMYMDDIKLYSSTPQSLHRLADITQAFSNDIHMKFGIDKCKTLSVKAGQIIPSSYILDSGETVEPLEPHTSYKYLGFQQARQINQKETKQELRQIFKHRLNALFRSQLNSRNVSQAINSYAVPVLTYSFGLINWSQSDLLNLQRMINTSLTTHRKHHPRSCVQRMTLSRDEGGRGIIDIRNLHNKQITTLRNYFYTYSEHSALHETVILADKHYTPLNLVDRNPQRSERITDVREKIAAWQQKSLHGRHRHDLQQPYVDKEMSNAWLRRGVANSSQRRKLS
ncbi:uncharacterized protein LOC113495889 [Trichoplusia ni]|uniref:Uncharacterized protein LOC113495889 n=1 Tax=Trichoplusia ni TaxID=7111 RepID=A0A7E5VRB5_TRINI|nr:uncharacterized protein LOC113495889 [Trichoplusia ni]